MATSRAKIYPQKILGPRAVKLLEDFVAKGSTPEFRHAFGAMIAELDMDPSFTPEAKALFGLELLLHEADEGFRDIEEACIYARDLLDAERATTASPKRCRSKTH